MTGFISSTFLSIQLVQFMLDNQKNKEETYKGDAHDGIIKNPPISACWWGTDHRPPDEEMSLDKTQVEAMMSQKMCECVAMDKYL